MSSSNRTPAHVERKVLAMLNRGVSGRQTAETLGVAESTLRAIKNRAEAAEDKQESRTVLVVSDLHFPEVHWPTWKLVMKFAEQNKIHGFVWLGDQFDNAVISHHNKGKGLLKGNGDYHKEQKGFDEKILKPLESVLPADAFKTWIIGNHDDWENQYVVENNELQGMIERPITLGLEERGWKVIPCGKSFTYGELTYIHGETLTTANHAKKALEVYCTNVLYGHFHGPQSATKVMPHDIRRKWQAHCSPIAGECNPYYMRNKPSGWMNGFDIVEYHKDGTFNLFPIITVDGHFSYGGKTYKS